MKEQDLADLKQLIEFLKQHQVAEFDLDRGDLKLRLKFVPQPVGPSVALGGVLSVAPAVTAAEPVVVPVAQEELHIVKSPIVGTFFSSPGPGAPNFVNVGERVEKGQVLCIVEAMKLMNEIEADAAGEVVKFLASDGQPVEYGQPLFAMRKA